MFVARFVSIAATCAEAGGMNFRGAVDKGMSHLVVAEALKAEMQDAGHRVPQFEEQLRTIYRTLPKIGGDLVDHQTTRSALHRHFSKQYGWEFGLGGTGNRMEVHSPTALIEGRTAAEDILQTFENSTKGSGTDLHGLAVLAAAMEDVVDAEVRKLLQLCYSGFDLAYDQSLPRADAWNTLYTFYIFFLLPTEGEWKFDTAASLFDRQRGFKKSYDNYAASREWFDTVAAQFLPADNATLVNFDSTAKAAFHIVKTYHSFNNIECKALKQQLESMEGMRPGRIRLSTFYKASRGSKWLFTERKDYLRALGSLDEESDQPSVILANYLLATPNCMTSSAVYSICCRNTCEGFTEHLESEIDTPTATPQKIASLIVNMPSSAGSAPRGVQDGVIPKDLLDRLNEIASVYGGEVPLHSRLFYQWMHHAYPLDCVYPEPTSTYTGKRYGDFTSATAAETEATAKEMQELIDADTCKVNDDGKPDCGESVDLPWSVEDADLLHGSTYHRKHGVAAARVNRGFYILFLIAIASLVFAARSKRLNHNQLQGAYLALLLFAFFAGLLNVQAFGLAIVGGICSVLAMRSQEDRKMLLPKTV